MEQLQSGDQSIRYDRERTEKAYADLKSGGAESCGCCYCRNFAAQRTTAYPEDFRQLLAQLGVDSQKEGEVYECGPADSMRVYGGWFYLAGELIEAGERMTAGGSGFQYYFVDAKRLPNPGADFGQNVLAIEFTMKLPWVIAESP
jgi:hypothetical protein